MPIFDITFNRPLSVSYTHLAHKEAFGDHFDNTAPLPFTGYYSFRKDGEEHAWNPETIAKLQLSTRLGDYAKFKEYTELVNHKPSPIFLSLIHI